MGQATASCSASSLLQVHHNFRWVLCGGHAEPVSGFLQRYLRRRLIAAGMARPRARCADSTRPAPDDDDDDDERRLMGRVVGWLPRAWQHLNAFLESRCTTADVTIGTPLQRSSTLLAFSLDLYQTVKPSLEVAPTTLLLIYCFWFRSAFQPTVPLVSPRNVHSSSKIFPSVIFPFDMTLNFGLRRRPSNLT